MFLLSQEKVSTTKITTKKFLDILVFLVPDQKTGSILLDGHFFFQFSTSSEKQSLLPFQSTPTVLFDKNYYNIIYKFILAMSRL